MGKTALATAFAVEHLTERGAEDISNCKRILRQMNKSGFNYTMPKKHLVYADYFIESRVEGQPRRQAYDIDGFRYALPNPHFKTFFEPPHSFVVFDEAQKYYNSRRSGLSSYVCRKYETHGHIHLDIVLVCQRIGMIDLNIRANAGRCIHVLDLKHKYDRHGDIVKSTWTGIEFDNCFDAEKFKEGEKTGNGTKFNYTFKGNIFKCYNSHNFAALHYKDNYHRSFDTPPAVYAGLSMPSMQEYNQSHRMECPDGFYGG